MAEGNQAEYFAQVIERLRREGELTRNNGTNSIKTVKQLMEEIDSRQAEQSEVQHDKSFMQQKEAINTFSGLTTAMQESGDVFTPEDFNTIQVFQQMNTEIKGLSERFAEFSQVFIDANDKEKKRGLLDRVENARDSKKQANNQIKLLKQIARNTKGGKGSGIGGMLSGFGNAGKGVGEGFKSIAEGIGSLFGTTFESIGKGLMFAGVGIGAVILSIVAVMRSFDEMAEGLKKLNELELDPEVFNSIGNAIGSLVKELGMGNAIGLKILSGVAFDDLGNGLERLNNLKFNPEGINNLGETLKALGDNTGIFSSKGIQMLGEVNFLAIADGIEKLNEMAGSVSPEEFKLIGQAIDNLLNPLSAFDAGEAGVLATVGQAVTPEFAQAIKQLGELNVDDKFEKEMASLGKGLDNLITPFGLLDTDNMLVVSSLAKGLPSLAEGVSGFTGFNAEEFKTNATLVGEGLQGLLDGTDDLFGAGGLQMIDDNIRPLANAVSGFTGIVDDAMANSFRKSSKIVGDGLQDLLDGTDDLFGATGLQMVDDNILPLAQGVKKFTDIVDDPMAESFRKSSAIIGQGFQDLLDGTDDLFGTTGLQAIDDNLLPFAEGVSAINMAGANLDLENFKAIGKAIDEVKLLNAQLQDLDFEPMEELELPLRKLHEFTSDVQTLMKGIGEGGEHEFMGLGVMGIGDSLDFGEGLLNADLKVDGILTKVQQIQDAIRGVVEIGDPQVMLPPTPEKQVASQTLDEQNREVAQQQSAGTIAVANTTNVGGNTNINQSTALVQDQNHNTQDTNDRSWFGGMFG
jgi:hypothetical protein